MSLWTWLRDFADRRAGDHKDPAGDKPRDPSPAQRPAETPAAKSARPPSMEDLLGGWAPFFMQQPSTTLEVTTKCATCGARNRVDMGRPGSVRCGACGLPLRVTATK